MARPKKTEEEITPLGKELVEAAEEMLAHSKGEVELPTYSYKVSDSIDVKKIRNSLHFTQEQFAAIIGASVHAVRHWENGRRNPDGTAKTLLHVLSHNPHAVMDALLPKN